ncbi:hypothetical protein L6452_17273 [Arctium lappa]|uniref:Uncharacterized protein n=1 Tax=Arctium lappa TaxID=4217 RepID=A0ACB9C346_ARCLA|nr:hypothetical protein L6452_17273 [Arctium lappa]
MYTWCEMERTDDVEKTMRERTGDVEGFSSSSSARDTPATYCTGPSIRFVSNQNQYHCIALEDEQSKTSQGASINSL